MKLLSVIMSIYILGLVIVPCVDACAENNPSSVSIESADMHNAPIDACTPFCSCNCCQSISYLIDFPYIAHFTSLIGTSISPINKVELSVSILHWTPPKIQA